MGHVIFILLFLAAPGADPDEIQIAQPMLYHGDEFHGTSGEWWGLYQLDDGSYTLQLVQVTVEPAEDYLGEAPDEKTAKQVTASWFEGKEPMFLFRGVDGWRAGNVACYADGWWPLEYGQELFLTDDEPYFELLATGHFDLPETPRFDLEYNMHLTRYDDSCEVMESQMIFSLNRFGETFPPLRWAGDLDRDGVPDLIFDLTYHYNVQKPTLFLSGYAEPGRMVRQVAELQTTGC